MQWKKASNELVEFIDAALAPFECQRRKMFGYPAYFVNGNMFAGLHQENIIVRLSERDREAILANPDEAVQFEPMPGRPMKEYVVLLDPVYGDPGQFRQWLDRSFQYVSTLPPKEAKPAKGKKGRSTQ